MKNKLSILVKNSLFNTYNINKMLKKDNPRKRLTTIVITGLIIFALILYILMYSKVGIQFLEQYGLQRYVPVLFLVMASMYIFITTIYKAKNTIFDVKDNDLLFSMPIKFSTILLSRVISLFIMNLLSSIIVFLPSAIVYATYESVGIMYYISTVVITLLIPIIPTVLASIIGYLIAYISSKTNSKKIIEIIITFIMFFGVMIVTSSLKQIALKFVENISGIEILMKRYLYPIHLVEKSLFSKSTVSLIIFILLNMIVTYIFIFLLQKGYKKIVSKLKEEKKKTKKGKTTYGSNGVISSLFKKEVKKYISTPVYVFNTAFGIILMIIATVYVFFIDINGINQSMLESGIEIELYYLMIIVTVFLTLMSNTTNSSISLEGQNLWVIKSLPITEKQIFKSKMLLNILLVSPLAILCIITVGIYMKITVLQLLLNILLVVILNICVAQFGILINLKFPKLEFISETQVVKQSMSTFVSTFIPMILAVIIAGVIMGLQGTSYIIASVPCLIVLFLIIILIQRVIMNTWGVKIFKSL